MATKTIELSSFSEELKKWSEGHTKAFKDATTNQVLKAIPRLVEKSPIDTGLYAQSWDTQMEQDGITLGNHAPHAPIIENGARPFTPPLGPLLAWAKRVLQDPSQPPNYSSHVWALAKHTQNKIAAEGMKPYHILENEIPVIMKGIIEEMRKSG